jgi:hypothetical protein
LPQHSVFVSLARFPQSPQRGPFSRFDRFCAVVLVAVRFVLVSGIAFSSIAGEELGLK